MNSKVHRRRELDFVLDEAKRPVVVFTTMRAFQ
jgi:hypothetical protein